MHTIFIQKFKFSKPYIAINEEVYIPLRHQELRSSKHFRYDFYCEELFIVKLKSKYRCKTAIFFNLPKDIIKDNPTFNYYFNNSPTKPVVLDGGNEIILANGLNKKSLEYTGNNDILNIPGYLYVLVNRSILYNCKLETEESFLLDSLAVCTDSPNEFKIYFTVNLAFVNYRNVVKNMKRLIIKNMKRLSYNLSFSFKII